MRPARLGGSGGASFGTGCSSGLKQFGNDVFILICVMNASPADC